MQAEEPEDRVDRVRASLRLYGVSTSRVEVAARPGGAVRDTGSVIRHRCDIPPDEIVEIGGLRCTGLDRTLLDVARFSASDRAIPCLDAGLQRTFGRDAGEAQHEWSERMLDRVSAMAGQRGVRRARAQIRFADGRAESMPESLSRLQLRRLGYEVEIQVPVPSPNDGMYRVDVELLGLGILAEIDGLVKYFESERLSRRSAAQVVVDERARENWIQGTTMKRLIRWGFAESRTAQALAARLRSFGVPPPVSGGGLEPYLR